MDEKKQDEVYESKAIVTTIKADSKITLKIRDNFYSITFEEERSIPNIDGVDLEMERRLLFDDVNAVVDEQAELIVKEFQK